MASVECIYNLKMAKLQLPVDIETNLDFGIYLPSYNCRYILKFVL